MLAWERTAAAGARLSVKIAERPTEAEEAFRLRYQVFAEEERNVNLLNETGIERDEYDAYCDHLIVRDEERDIVVGTYRLLPGRRTADGIGFYSESEFELGTFAELRTQTLELGRSCIHPDYRDGRAIQLLWGGIARYSEDHGYDWLCGCASVHIDSADQLNEIYTLLLQKNVITDAYGIRPRGSHRIEGLRRLDQPVNERLTFRKLPPLMKGYQWLGAEIGGEPAFDPVFGTTDFLILMEKTKLNRKYRKLLG